MKLKTYNKILLRIAEIVLHGINNKVEVDVIAERIMSDFLTIAGIEVTGGKEQV